jgi:hypothetical protein
MSFLTLPLQVGQRLSGFSVIRWVVSKSPHLSQWYS